MTTSTKQSAAWTDHIAAILRRRDESRTATPQSGVRRIVEITDDNESILAEFVPLDALPARYNR